MRRIIRGLQKLSRFTYRFVGVLIWLLLSVVILAVFASWWTVDHFQLDVGELPALIEPSKSPLPGPIRVYSADNKLIASTERQRRIIVNGRAIDRDMKNATLAIEDQRFYEHRGVDFQALARAVWVDLRTGQPTQGASTLTMQYIRNVYLNAEKTSQRKLREVALALQLESIWSKDRILSAYLNTVYYGNGAYGVEAASLEYFRSSADDLSPAQAALLAGVTNDPQRYDPRVNPEDSWGRARIILAEMYNQNRLSQKEYLKARSEMPELEKSKIRQDIRDRQIWAAAQEELKRTVSPERLALGNMTVRLSIRYKDIRKARKILKDVYKNIPAPRPVVAASFVEPETGRILLMASSRKGGYFGFARQAYRQPGSTVKLFTTAAYFQEGGQTIDPVNNSPLKVKDGSRSYTVTPTGNGNTVGQALRFSQNPAFWRLYQRVGGKTVLRLQKNLGLTKMDSNPAAALGGVKEGTTTLELSGAMAGFANDGQWNRPHMIVEIDNRQDGSPLYRDGQMEPRKAIDSEYARRLNLAARQVVESGPEDLQNNIKLAKTRQVAGKTGTSEDNADAWFTGYTPQFSGAVWTGYPESRRSLKNLDSNGDVFGATIPARTWEKLARIYARRTEPKNFPKPQGLARIPQVEDKSSSSAVARIQKFGFTNIKLLPVFDPSARSEKVLSVKPRAGTWMRRDSEIVLRYQQSSRPTPNFVGDTYLDVYDELGRYIKLKPKLVPSPQPTGTVLAQYPYAGEAIRAGGELQLTLATRRAPARIVEKRVEYVPSDSELARLRKDLSAARRGRQRASDRQGVPDVTGLGATDAGQVLSSLGFKLEINGSSLGFVQTQSPSSGSKRFRGSEVEVTLTGPEPEEELEEE